MLDGRVALVTGGGQGLGEAFARELAAQGCRIIVADINAKTAGSVADSIRAGGSEAIAIQVDISRVDMIEAMAKISIEHFGAVDILVNSAGIFDVVSIDDTTEEIWDRGLDINLKGLFFCIRALAPLMRERRYGKIINMTSIAGLGGFLNCPAYCASKGGIVNLTKAVACELAPYGITVNAVAPGPVETPINNVFEFDNPKGDAHRAFLRERTPSRVDFYKPADIVGTVIYLASPASDAVTGVTIPVDGGWCAW
ncbi:SDR family NAD(P)-dependent oxidoreductase [Lutibaculum baratangense]|uniref:3-oxoacyl-[acyl-carrier protein] reductase n=1 Tax=Lutibaculum baratangense AMV1 TaxID=631454 RepID=V4RPV7_9HYPH|nr:glucose 1-dehydrogenase [Lutibaculum baratangense]ESR25225.1 3-oxoacyl-[acyl-carrier protein] reductase [Lutibaculum baratangense AMV1]